MERWLLIDGFNLMYRCYYATPSLARSDGFPTNAMHGWMKSLWRLMDQEKPTHTSVFFDLGGSAERLALHPSYKAQRKAMPDELSVQIAHIKLLTRSLGLAVVEENGIESDDLLASCAVQKAQGGDDVLIVSSDKDFAQIVSPRIRLLLPPPSAQPKLGWRRLDESGVFEKFGVNPNQIADYLAIVGDVSDNIPGLNGAGPKTVSKWLAQYGSLRGIISAAPSLNPERFRAPLLDSQERLFLNLRLTTLNVSLSLPQVFQTPPDLASLTRLLSEMDMNSALTGAVQRYHQQELF